MPAANPERSIFLAALELPTPAERAAYLKGACGADAALLANVRELLAAQENGDDFLDRPPPNATVDKQPVTERPGTVIGPYKLKEQIGEGGMGLVFVAEQQEPVRRKVALKIIKPGMDSKQVIARFEAERQALAMMDHQNIAKVFDAGTTESGRPYFVMELVHGVPITEFCDANKFTPRQRLELFVPVCQAIQHAHQKGIIHRDIKPSNVLVTMYDDKPVPKVIDFGVAKAIEQRLTEKSVYTQFGTLVGTFEYMSPEQAEMNAFGVDTRSDIYAMGVLLYELLTGTTPLERQRLGEAAFDEIRRIIKEEEPQRPSVRLSTSAIRAKVAEARKTEPAKLSRLMRGELDWVVMKCLEKDRSRRYDTASGLAKDVERHLKDEPVEARPPSAGYLLRKAARRNRTALAVSGVVAAALILGTAVAVWQAIRAAEAETARLDEQKRNDDDRRKREEEIATERRQVALERATEAALSGDLWRADQAILEAERAEVSADQSHWLRGLVLYQRGKFDDAIKEFEASIAVKPNVAAAAMHLTASFALDLIRGLKGNASKYKYRAILETLEPVTAEDFMCRAFVPTLWNRERSKNDAAQAIALRKQPIAYAVRAIVYTRVALDQGDLRAGEEAGDDLLRAKSWLPDNSFVRNASLYHHLLLADLYAENRLPDKQRATLEEARDDARALEHLPISVYVMTRVYYYEHIGDENAALELLRQASAREETKDLAVNYALALYRKKEFAAALKVLEDHQQPGNFHHEFIRLLILADHPDHGRDKAYAEYKNWQARNRSGSDPEPSRDGCWDEITLMLLFDKRSEAIARTNDIIAIIAKTTRPEYAQPWKLLAERFAGNGSDDAAIQFAGTSRINLCHQYHFVGLARLMDGDRKGAREAFQKCLDTGLFSDVPFKNSRVFLDRLTNDPTWPEWIKAKQ